MGWGEWAGEERGAVCTGVKGQDGGPRRSHQAAAAGLVLHRHGAGVPSVLVIPSQLSSPKTLPREGAVQGVGQQRWAFSGWHFRSTGGVTGTWLPEAMLGCGRVSVQGFGWSHSGCQ